MWRRQLIEFVAASVVGVSILNAISSTPRAQGVPAIDKRITYILPHWSGLLSATQDEITAQAVELHNRIGDGPRVRLGFTTYISVVMSPVDPTDAAAVRAALDSTVAQIDSAIARASTANVALCLSFVTALRETTDPLESAAQSDDRRNMQWWSDNTMATGWATLSRYARKQEAIRAAYIRELGKVLANRMAQYPDTLVAASGDGEIELAAPGSPLIADYSPFAVAEFRDWLRGTGLYAAGQPFAGEAYANSSRYASDASLATLNSDFNLTLDTWNLTYFDWSLSDPVSPDPHAIPASQYNDPSFNRSAISYPNGFDPPRTHTRGNAWSDLWDRFREAMVYRHNREFAQWITSSGVPVDRWFTDQVPGDYLFGGTPSSPNPRLDTSASTIATADVTPYGSLGITSFNVKLGEGAYARTLAGAAPVIFARHVRWGVFEWNPCIPAPNVAPCTDMTVYRQEMDLVKQYHPSVLAPFYWAASPGDPYRIEGTSFETALHELATALNNVPLTLSRNTLNVSAITTGSARTPAQTIRVSGAPGESPGWAIASAPNYLDLVPAADHRSFTVALTSGPFQPGVFTGQIVVAPSEPGYVAATVTVTFRASLPGTTRLPVGSLDTPAENASVAGETPITGWAVDDIGVTNVAICRALVSGEGAGAANFAQCGGLPNVFIGNATFVPGARPDIVAFAPDSPLNEQAGWGYMLLSNFLPNGGNGPFTLSAVATDVDGHSVEIGRRHIVAANSLSPAPFGTIDTPAQGEVIGGSQYVNFGWALAPNRNTIPFDGSTIYVAIDNVIVGHPDYGHARADIDSLFPGYNNTGHAVGFYIIDTTKLSNGLHTIAWIVQDAAGNTQGIGSRFFTVSNP